MGVQVQVSCFCSSRRPPDFDKSSEVTWSANPICGHICHTVCMLAWNKRREEQNQPPNCPMCRGSTEAYYYLQNGRKQHFMQTHLYFDNGAPSSDDFSQSQSQDIHFPASRVAARIRDPMQSLQDELVDLRKRDRETRATLLEVKERHATESSSLIRTILEKDREIAELTEEVKELQKGQPDLREQLANQQAQLRKLEEDHETAVEELGTLHETERAELERRINELEGKQKKLMERVKKEGNSGAATIKDLTEKIKKLNERIKAHAVEAEAAAKEAKAIEARHAKEVQKLNDKITSQRSTIEEHRNQQSVGSDESKRLREEIGRIIRANESYRLKLNKLQIKYKQLKQRGSLRLDDSSPEPEPFTSTSRARNVSREPLVRPQRHFNSPSPPAAFTMVNSAVPISPRKVAIDNPLSSDYDDDILIMDTVGTTFTSPGKKSQPMPSLLSGVGSSFGRAKRPLEAQRSDKYLPDFTSGLVDAAPKKKNKLFSA